ncbi:MAG: response regulator [candidate division KSB1 bacterium]|nr:response regulator [candidate division KSB1 bacterium]
MHVLVVEDDENVRYMVEKILDIEGHKVTTAENGKQALNAIYKDKTLELMITDIVMPEKEGMETIQEAKENRPDLKIIAISGGGRIMAQDYLNTAKILGADLTLKKPFRRQDILDAVEMVMNSDNT